MAHFELLIKDLGTADGWRIVTKQNQTQFRPNPTVRKGDTVSWHSPQSDACIAILATSPFTRIKTAVTNEVLEIPKGGTSGVLTIAGNAIVDEEYEYAVLVRDGRDYTYVRGAHSPPGVIVGGP